MIKSSCSRCFLYQPKPNKCILGHKIPREDCSEFCKDKSEYDIIKQHSDVIIALTTWETDDDE